MPKSARSPRNGSEEFAKANWTGVSRRTSDHHGLLVGSRFSAIAYLEMDEAKSRPTDGGLSSFHGEAEESGIRQRAGTNPVVRVLVAPIRGGEPRAMDTGSENDIYIPRVDWLVDSRRVAIQRLNREQTVLDLLIADAGSGKSRSASPSRIYIGSTSATISAFSRRQAISLER